MILNSFNPEFGYELISVIPYAYYLSQTGALTKTISAKGTESLYYFSPDHEINPEPRSWANTEKLLQSGIPNAYIHKSLNDLELDRFRPPPYKEKYQDVLTPFLKPLCVISNRYNNEWTATKELNRPINYFDLEVLEKMFKVLCPKYDVVYINIDGRPDLCDTDNLPLPLGDFELCKCYPVLNIHDLGKDFNLNQLGIFSQCQKFITTNGGGSILASYFGGTNIIYSKNTILNGRSYPKEHQTGDWEYYHLFGGSDIKVCLDYEELIEKVEML